jgi:hypothetical protein
MTLADTEGAGATDPRVMEGDDHWNPLLMDQRYEPSGEAEPVVDVYDVRTLLSQNLTNLGCRGVRIRPVPSIQEQSVTLDDMHTQPSTLHKMAARLRCGLGAAMHDDDHRSLTL